MRVGDGKGKECVRFVYKNDEGGEGLGGGKGKE